MTPDRSPRRPAIAWVGLGTNLGDRRENLRVALRGLARQGTVQAVSTVYRSEPVGFREQPDFWNAVARLETTLDPPALLRAAHDVEQAAGRTRPFPNAPRTLDIDLLLYDEVVLNDPGLVLPHPRLRERAFVLRPLAELDAELRHPVTGERIADLASAPGLPAVEPLFAGSELLNDEARDGAP